MRQFGIEIADEGIEALLALKAVGAVAVETRTKGMIENPIYSSPGSAEFSDPNARLCV
jgi:hypothetical protein